MPCVSICLVTATTSHKWEVTDKRFCLKLRPAFWLLDYQLGPWRNKRPLSYLGPLHLPTPAPIPLCLRGIRAMESTGWKTTSWHEVPWEPGRNYRMMCQNLGNGWSLLCLCCKRINLNFIPGHWESKHQIRMNCRDTRPVPSLRR